MARIIDAFAQFLDGNGDPLVNGKLRFFESGTNNTDKYTFADINETIPNSNPVILDGEGRCPNVFGTGSYNVISYTSAGVQIQQFDPVSSSQDEGAFSEWDSQTNYSIGDIVTSPDGLYYRAIVANQNQDPSSSPGQWEEVQLREVWNNNVTYATNDLVVLDGIFYRSLVDSNTGNNPTTNPAKWGSSVASVQDFSESVVKLIHPDQSKGLQELQKQGVYPVSFNQQWGGMGYGGLPDGSMGEVATCNISSDGTSTTINATNVNCAFKVPVTSTVESVFIKIYKTSNLTGNTTVTINGQSEVIPEKTITNNTDGEWVRVDFSTPPSVTADTSYNINVATTGNAIQWMDGNGNYPHGGNNQFIIVTANKILSTGLTGFDGAIHCYQGAPLDQSGAFYFANDDLNNKRGTIHYAGTGFTKDKTFHDSGLGTDNNRIVIRTNVTTGYAQVDLYENDGIKHTVTGTTDISTGNHIVSVGYRAEGDGSDYLKLYIDGVSEGTEITAATITLDPQFVSQGHTTIGGGFPLAPTWTLDSSDGSVLPSNAANDTFIFTGTGTEANCFAAEGDYWAQNGAGYAATDTGYYSKTTTFANATGLVAVWSNEVSNSTNGAASDEAAVVIHDGSKVIKVFHHEYFLELNDGATIGYVQIDNTKQNHFLLSAKGSDFYLYANGKLIFDGTGLYDAASASNTAGFGDYSATSGDTATVKWYYFKTYEGAHLPEYSDIQISEFAQWNDDKSALLSTIYNAGSIQSVKTLAGLNENYVKTKKQVISVKGITSSPTTASTSFVPVNEVKSFTFGENINTKSQLTVANANAGGSVVAAISVDGAESNPDEQVTQGSVGGEVDPLNPIDYLDCYGGLHFVSTLWKVDTGTGTLQERRRKMITEAE